MSLKEFLALCGQDPTGMQQEDYGSAGYGEEESPGEEYNDNANDQV